MDEKLIRGLTKAVNELWFEWFSPEEPYRSRLDNWFLPGRHQALCQRSSPYFPEVNDEIVVRPLLISHPSFFFRCSNICWWRWRKRIQAPASSGWVCGRTLLPAHSYRIEGEGEPSVQAVQSYICTRWTCLLGGWTSSFSTSLDGCAPGLSGQDAFQWGSRSGFSLSQGPEEHDRPGSTHHQSHRPSHRAFYVQPDSVEAPPLAHDDGDERGRQSSLPRPLVSSGSLFLPAVESFAEHFTEAQKSSRAMQDFLLKRTNSSSVSSRPRPAPTQQTAKPTPTDPEPRPPQDRRDRRRTCSAWCYPFPKRQLPRLKIALDPAPQKSSWTARQKEEEPSLATAGPPRKQPLLCLSLPRLAIGTEES